MYDNTGEFQQNFKITCIFKVKNLQISRWLLSSQVYPSKFEVYIASLAQPFNHLTFPKFSYVFSFCCRNSRSTFLAVQETEPKSKLCDMLEWQNNGMITETQESWWSIYCLATQTDVKSFTKCRWWVGLLKIKIALL